MKGKFRSMWRVGIALVLVLSLSLVVAAPVPAATPADTDVGFQFGITSTATVTWESGAGNVDTGNYSVKLDNDTGSDIHPYVEFIPAPGTTMSDLATIGTTGFRSKSSPAIVEPNMELRFTAPDFDPTLTGQVPHRGHADVSITNVGPSGDWETEDATANPTVYFYANDPVDGTAFDNDAARTTLALTLAAIDEKTEMGDDSAADWELTRVRIELSWAEPGAVYIDDITIDGVTYELEPIFLDAEYYSVDDTVTVTVPNFAANTDPLRINPVADEQTGSPPVPDGNWIVEAESDSEPLNVITVALEETGANTGVFTGSFGITSTIPVAEGKLYVQDGASITVTYTGSDQWWGDSDDETVVIVLVDATPPTIDDTLTVDDEGILVDTPGTIIYSTEPVIVATYEDLTSGIDESSVEMTVNGTAVTPTITGTTVTYEPPESAFDAGDTVEVTVDVDDLAGNAADTASWSFTIADEFNVSLNKDEIAAAATTTDVIATFKDVNGAGTEGLLDTVKVTITGPGVDLESGDYVGDGGTTKGAATAGDTTSLTFSVTPEQAGTITVTFVGTFTAIGEADPVVITKTLDIDVTGFVVEETWVNVELGDVDDISMTITTKAGTEVNTGVVTITALAAGGFEKNVDGVAGDESFTTIVIDGSAGQITYDAGDPEDFVVMNGYYEVTGVKFAEVGAVNVLVATGATPMAEFPTAFTVLGNPVYEVLLDPVTVTAGVATDVAVTVTEDEDPVISIDSIEVADQTFGPLTSADGVYEIALDPIPEEGPLSVTVTGEGDQKYGTADLTIGLPTVDYTIYETVDEEEVERNVMLTGVGNDYTVSVTVTDALGDPLASGNVWLGTYDETATPPLFTALGAVVTAPDPWPPLTLEADGTGDIVITQTGINGNLLTAGTLVWKIGSGAAVDDAALILDLDQAITVEDFAYSLDYETPVIAGQSLTVSVLNNYEVLQKYMGITLRNPDSTTDPFSTGNTGTFTFTPAVAGDYEVYSGSVSVENFIDTITVNGEAPPDDILAYYRGYSGDAEVVDTTDLLKAANDWSNAVVPPGFTEPISTIQLLTLANEWAATG